MELQEIERCAMHNEPLPDSLGQPEQYAYLCLRRLYQDYYSRRIPKEQAQREKKQCCRAYREAHHREQQRLETMRAAVGSGESFRLCPDTDYSNSRYGRPVQPPLSLVKCLCLLRSEMVSYELIEQKINERRQSDAKNTKEQTAGTGD